MDKPKDTLNTITAAETETLKQSPAYREALILFHRELSINPPEGSKVPFEITAVEPFTELLKKIHIESFDEKPRQAGEIYVTWHRGYPQINIVIDPEQRSVVCIKGIKANGKEVSIPQALKVLGIDRANFPKGKDGYPNFKNTVDETLDGLQTTPDTENPSPVTIEKIKERTQTVAEIRKDTNAKIADNSLGKLVKIN